MTEYLKRFRESAALNPWPDTKDMPCYIGIGQWGRNEAHVCKLIVDHEGGQVLVEPMAFLPVDGETFAMAGKEALTGVTMGTVQIVAPGRPDDAVKAYIEKLFQTSNVLGAAADAYLSNYFIGEAFQPQFYRDINLMENEEAAVADLQSLSRYKRLRSRACPLLNWMIGNAKPFVLNDGAIVPTRDRETGGSLAGFSAMIAANVVRLYPTLLGYRPSPRPKERSDESIYARVAAAERAPVAAHLDAFKGQIGAAAPAAKSLDKFHVPGGDLRGREFRVLQKAAEQSRLNNLAADIKELQRLGKISL